MSVPLIAITIANADASAGPLLASWQLLVLGIVQGLTEFLPISSTAHLKVVPVLLGWGDPGVAVTAVLQLGSIAAVVAYFSHDLAAVLRALCHALRQRRWSSPDARLGLGIAWGTLPILAAGALIEGRWAQAYGASPLRGLTSIAIVSILMALLLAAAEQLGSQQRGMESIRVRDGLWLGLAQALALIPGVSRSGSTLTAALLWGWRRDAAARFSFLLGLPAITLAGVVELRQALAAADGPGALPLLVGVAASALASWLAIDWLLGFLRNHSTMLFVLYRLAFGVALLTLVASGRF